MHNLVKVLQRTYIQTLILIDTFIFAKNFQINLKLLQRRSWVRKIETIRGSKSIKLIADDQLKGK